MNMEHRVFVFEKRLYGSNKKIYHLIREKNKSVYTKLFQPDNWPSLPTPFSWCFKDAKKPSKNSFSVEDTGSLILP